jgi:hypothetical protein
VVGAGPASLPCIESLVDALHRERPHALRQVLIDPLHRISISLRAQLVCHSLHITRIKHNRIL